MVNVSHIKSASRNFCNMGRSSKDEYLKKIQNTYRGTKIPNDFDAWTVQEQHDWVRQNITETYQSVPESLRNMVPAIFRPVDFNRSQVKLPEWMDIDKYHKGQQFVRDHYFSVIISVLLGAIYGLTFDDGLKALIISGNSYTPYLTFKRYLNTIIRIVSWFDGEPWVKGTKAYLSMQIARIKHVQITRKMMEMNEEQIKAASKIANPMCLEHEFFLKDFTLACPFGKLAERPYKATSLIKKKPINNASVSIAQGTFILLSVMHSQNVGMHDVTDEDLEAFCHMWRCYGYFLGLEDEYNFCRGSLKEIKQRTRDLSQKWIAVNFTDITTESMHLTRCFIESLNYYPLMYMPHKTMILIFTKALNLKMPNLYASLNYREWIVYNVVTFLLRHALKFSIVREIANRLLHKIIETASNFGPQELTKLQEKSKHYLLEFSNKS